MYYVNLCILILGLGPKKSLEEVMRSFERSYLFVGEPISWSFVGPVLD